MNFHQTGVLGVDHGTTESFVGYIDFCVRCIGFFGGAPGRLSVSVPQSRSWIKGMLHDKFSYPKLLCVVTQGQDGGDGGFCLMSRTDRLELLTVSRTEYKDLGHRLCTIQFR